MADQDVLAALNQWLTKLNLSNKVAQAYSRFTKAPIEISNVGENKTLPSGSYGDEASNWRDKIPRPEEKIRIQTNNNNDFRDIQHVLSHEDVHALLGKEKLQSILAPQKSIMAMPYPNEPLIPKKFGLDPQSWDIQRFDRSNRSGNAILETPPYGTMYKPGELSGMDKGLSDEYTTRLIKSLPEKVAQTLMRMKQVHDSVTQYDQP